LTKDKTLVGIHSILFHFIMLLI